MKPMNLLIITSDQHNKNMLGSYGNEYIKTPNLDRLALNGVVFDNAYCNSPLCVPSRASMATGNYASSNGYWDNAHAFGGEVPSWGKRLDDAGHKVTTIGKLHFLGDIPETGFLDQRLVINVKDGIGDLYGGIRRENVTRPQFRGAIDNATEGESDYVKFDRAVTDQTVEFLKTEAKNLDKPFVLYASIVTPHFPLIVPKEFLDLYPDKSYLKKPVEFDKEDWPHHPVIDAYRKYCGTEDVGEEEAYNALRTYYALCSFMDAQVGRMLDALEESGLADNTRVIYSTDHGDTMGEHGVFYKSTMYEGSCGVPLIVSGPDLPKNKRVKTNVSLVDIFPSVIECVGLEAKDEDKNLPGSSLWQFAMGKEELDRTVFSEYYSFGTYDATYMVRKGDYKYIHYVNARPQLFNIGDDPDEVNDLASNESYKQTLKELEKELRTIVDVEGMDEASKKAQAKLIEEQGGEKKIIENLNPSLFSPIPNLK